MKNVCKRHNAALACAVVAWVKVGEPEVHRQRGKWVVRQAGYDAATGRRRIKQLGTFETRRAAVAKRKEFADGQASTDMQSLEDFLDEVWLPSKDGRVESTTLGQYRWAIEGHIVPRIGAVRLRDLTPEIIDRWIAELAKPNAEGRARLGPTSIRLVRKVLSMALEEAVERGRLPRNPVRLSQPPRRRRSTAKLGWTLEEARTFLGATREHRLHAAFHLCLVTGLRRGEVLGLRWQDLDLDAAELRVVQQLAVDGGRPVLKLLKTDASNRVVTFGTGTVTLLAAHRADQEAEMAFAGDAFERSGLVFTTALGGWIDPNNFSRTMDVLITKAGVPRITPKGLRHTAQSIGRVVVGDDKVMQERLGHADIEVTLNTYTHLVSDQHREAGARLDAVFS
jgi:integrase